MTNDTNALVMSTTERVLKCGNTPIVGWRMDGGEVTFDINYEWLNRLDSDRLSKADAMQLAIAIRTAISDAEDCYS